MYVVPLRESKDIAAFFCHICLSVAIVNEFRDVFFEKTWPIFN